MSLATILGISALILLLLLLAIIYLCLHGRRQLEVGFDAYLHELSSTPPLNQTETTLHSSVYSYKPRHIPYSNESLRIGQLNKSQTPSKTRSIYKAHNVSYISNAQQGLKELKAVNKGILVEGYFTFTSML